MSTVDKRNYGIDLVKVVAMFLVVVVHILHGGGATKEVAGMTKYALLSMKNVAFCCINLFALSTGFLEYGKKVKLSRLIQLWIQVLFWSVTVGIAIALYRHDFVYLLKNFYTVLFVISSNSYWYFSAYVALFFVIPIINYSLNHYDSKKIFAFLSVFMFLLTVVPYIIGEDWYTHKGYSFVWLIFMYIIGALIKKHDICSKVKMYKLLIFAVVLFVIGSVVAILTYSIDIEILKRYQGVSLNYNFPLVVLISIVLFLLIAKIQVKSKFMKGTLRMLSATSFSVYLIHVQPLLFKNYFEKSFIFIGHYPWYKAIGVVLLCSVIIYVSCTVLGWIQMKLFKLIKINKLCDFVAKKIILAYNKIYSRFLYKLEENKNIT